jgi:hypothetical protein
MSSIFDGIDMSDPCALLPKFQELHDRLIAGENVVKARFGDDEKEWQRGDVSAIAKRIRELKNECALRQGRRPARRAITFG